MPTYVAVPLRKNIYEAQRACCFMFQPYVKNLKDNLERKWKIVFEY